MNSLNFLTHRPRKRRQFAVIGLGRFGRAVCQTLHQLGHEVLGTDVEEKLVSQVLSERIVDHAIQLDATEIPALKESGLLEIDTHIIAIGNYLQESVITTLNVKEAGVKTVVAKASSEVHGKILQRVGADHVVYPEFEAGRALAFNLTKSSILDRFELDTEHSIVEVKVPEKFHNKTLEQLNLRSSYGVSVLALSKAETFSINPLPQTRLQQGALMVVIGRNQDIQKLPI
ncbi:MAG: TrkA family potassium uptake protein [Cyanobacteria bacterium P01_H01_bin.15]